MINTGTTIIAFLMVFLIQSTQNRDGAAVQIKLDELIRAMQGAHNSVLNLEEMSEEELERVKADYLQLAERARAHLKAGRAKKNSSGQTEIGKSPGRGKAATKASTA